MPHHTTLVTFWGKTQRPSPQGNFSESHRPSDEAGSSGIHSPQSQVLQLQQDVLEKVPRPRVGCLLSRPQRQYHTLKRCDQWECYMWKEFHVVLLTWLPAFLELKQTPRMLFSVQMSHCLSFLFLSYGINKVKSIPCNKKTKEVLFNCVFKAAGREG